MHDEHAPHLRNALRGRRVLVVEGEALLAMVMGDGLVDAGADVVGPACSADEALDLIDGMARDDALHAAVLDLHLAGTPVSPVADRLASLGVPFLFATGYGEDCDKRAHVTAPVLTKPFDPDTLVAAVAGLAAAGPLRRSA